MVLPLDSKAGEAAHVFPTFLPGGDRFLFLALEAGGVNLRIKAGSLSSADIIDIAPAQSKPLYASTGELLFVRNGALMAQGFNPDTLSLSDGEARRIVDGVLTRDPPGSAAVSLSDTGMMVYRTGAGYESSRLTWYDRQGNRGATVGDPAAYRGIGFSGDGHSVVVHKHEEPGGGDLWVIDTETGNGRKITYGGHNFAPLWAHHDDSIIFSADRDGNAAALYRKPASGAGEETAITKLPAPAYAEDISADGRTLLFGSVGPPGRVVDIFRLTLGAGDAMPEALISSTAFEGFAKFAPDEQWLLYEALDAKGVRQIWVRPYPLQGEIKWAVTTEGGRYGRWSHDGKELYYLKEDGTMMAVEILPPNGGAFRASPLHKTLFRTNAILSNHRGSTVDIPYDVTEDGRFLVNERVNTNISFPLTVVLDWPALLSR